MVVSESYLYYRTTISVVQNKKDSMILVFFSGCFLWSTVVQYMCH